MTSPALFKRLIALTRLHTSGMGPFLSRLRIVRSNAVAAAAGLRAVPDGLTEVLSRELGFEACGFTDERMEAWLARDSRDVLALQAEHGFKLQVLARYVSDRERKGLSHQYRFCLLAVSFGTSCRYALLRMTGDKLDELLKELRSAKELPTREFSYSKQLRALMELKLLTKSNLKPRCAYTEEEVQQAMLSAEEKVEDLLDRIDQHLSGVQKLPAAAIPPALNIGGEKVTRKRMTQDVSRMIEVAFDVTHDRRIKGQKTIFDGVTNAGMSVPVHTEVLFPGELVEHIEKPKTLEQHVVVVQVHASGLTEIIYNGPQSVLYDDQVPSTKEKRTDQISPGRPAKRLLTERIRALGMTVPSDHRLKLRRVS